MKVNEEIIDSPGDVRTKIKNGYYKNCKDYPVSKRVCHSCLKLADPTRSYCPGCGVALVPLEEHNKMIGDMRKEYNAEENRLSNLFKCDLEKEFDMVGHPKSEILFHKAWEDGHSGGMIDVLNEYDDLIDLVL